MRDDNENLRITDLRKVYQAKSTTSALAGISIDIVKGELLIVLGPSGCGKTTLLRSIAGLESPTSGKISIFGRLVVDAPHGITIPAHKRNVGMVFQNYALWPHMTVLDNVAYPLRARGNSRIDARAAATQMLETLRCGDLVDRYPSQLSGGQQQRVAVGRSLVGNPQTVLFDEPLSNIDEQLRSEVRAEIRRLHSEFHFTGVYVTHDQREGLEMASRIAIMEKGRVVQLATPFEIFNRPASAGVARFLGVENTIVCTKVAGRVTCGALAISGNWDFFPGMRSGCFEVLVRSDDLGIRTSDSAGSISGAGEECRILDGVVVDAVYRGGTTQSIVRVAEKLLYSTSTTVVAAPGIGDRVQCYFDSGRALPFHVDSAQVAQAS